MKLFCDLCGHVLTEIDDNNAICQACGLEYGAERLQEMHATMAPEKPVPPVVDTPPVKTPPKMPQEPKNTPEKPEQKSGCGIWFWLIVGILDLIVGTHGIVAVICLIIICFMSRSSKK